MFVTMRDSSSANSRTAKTSWKTVGAKAGGFKTIGDFHPNHVMNTTLETAHGRDDHVMTCE